MKAILRSVGILILGGMTYLLTWPVPIEPVSWTAPADPGYAGPFAVNERLAGVEMLPIDEARGPEDVAIDAEGRIYGSTREGWIVRLDADGSNPVRWAETRGRPLGIDFDGEGNLVVADAFRGLLSIAPDASVRLLADEADGRPIRYADDVDVAADGTIYFSDATGRFAAVEWSDTYDASLLDLMEHGRTGRLLAYDPATGRATTLLDGLSFANGVAVSPDQSFVLVNETGEYRVVRYWLSGPRSGSSEPLIGELPGFPDNVSAGLDGRFWVALVAPRNAVLDATSGRPWLRKVVQRLPAFLRPAAASYGHVIAVDRGGNVVEDLQDPAGTYPLVTGVTETEDHLYLGSLVAPGIGRLAR
jgi:sugar lactone lactonase YvrE